MLSKNKTKFINSLQKKKNRDKEGLFIVEGTKMVNELLHSDFQTEAIYHLPSWHLAGAVDTSITTEITPGELRQISSLTTPNQVLAIARIKTSTRGATLKVNDLTLALDAIRDPGNLGTLIRLADWFGIGSIICSNDSVDVYNPKVVQATMGAIFRVQVQYADLTEILTNKPENYPVYGTFMEGDNLYTTPLSAQGCIVLGNEGMGISKEIENLVTQKLHIPNFNPSPVSSESLNISIAGAIVCAEFRRSALFKMEGNHK